MRGCYACRMACQMINKLEPEEAFISYKEIEQGTYPSVYAETVPVQCMHCKNAPASRCARRTPPTPPIPAWCW